MKKRSCFFILLAVALNLKAQPVSFSLIAETSLIKTKEEPYNKFGGISSIEAVPVGLIDSQALDPERRILLLTSDHSLAGKEEKSYCFTMTPDLKIRYLKSFFGLNNIESVRYNAKLNRVFFAYEEDEESGVGYIGNDRKAKMIWKDKNGFYNRGIEGITFTSDNSLWIANESLDPNISGNYDLFRMIPYDEKLGYDTTHMKLYKYPFDKKSCLRPDQQFNGVNGNGVSEILALKDDPNKMLVMERCFNKATGIGSVRLYMATVVSGSDVLRKELVFDCNEHFIPDNLEGMAWGIGEGEEDMLYLISDDNFSGKQRNELVKLKMSVRE